MPLRSTRARCGWARASLPAAFLSWPLDPRCPLPRPLPAVLAPPNPHALSARSAATWGAGLSEAPAACGCGEGLEHGRGVAPQDAAGNDGGGEAGGLGGGGGATAAGEQGPDEQGPDDAPVSLASLVEGLVRLPGRSPKGYGERVSAMASAREGGGEQGPC